jgi:hypothetical protein
MRFSMRNRTIDIDNYLHHSDFPEKKVTDISIVPSEGNIYVHWEEE